MYSMTTLSPRRSAILTFIRERIAEHGQPPSLAEISEAFGFASRSVARKHVVALTEAGFIEVNPNQARGIRLLNQPPRPEWLEIPVLGRVAAGLPIGADAEVHNRLLLDPALFSRTPDYLLRVQGDSMIEDGILDGDLVAVRRDSEVRNGQIVVARLDGEVTIKRFERLADGVRLLPRNPAYAPILIGEDRDLAIEGVFCGLVRQG
ncbi:SOS-response transcriptional repressor, LexA [Pseudomonas chlororaphis]|uniref:LexA repressor n=1 Tax=Pseudomonas chlororaphis subsp. aureofaciens TaxID=587851 RepID=A0AAD0ZKJ0_9PSED|nr:transcriptional repressor LexA [Pseudomonas chlororaphis]AZD49261.1 SOS-response repressor and protease LexA [Pseudomonas chlororaphis subsp. aurantiaca]AZD68023.1 SOS-response repressor and protease LexA [Pseudomonas chlororaphis subsp. aurantiaca]AZD74212.1 SOS-response repressor and protease LexA [Pseudomonas chlororaphis subsp. aurantiaca]AZE24358.1 SOS-response repressor and protease LexA [Pseudomonas chlororaphis subsp. aureofaciens]AZE30642.1 SOS-response repressor and protease LexA 